MILFLTHVVTLLCKIPHVFEITPYIWETKFINKYQNNLQNLISQFPQYHRTHLSRLGRRLYSSAKTKHHNNNVQCDCYSLHRFIKQFFDDNLFRLNVQDAGIHAKMSIAIKSWVKSKKAKIKRSNKCHWLLVLNMKERNNLKLAEIFKSMFCLS